jgi:two-component system chemotaxis response regulator CheY
MFAPDTRLLLVEDVESVRTKIQQQLQALGFQDVTLAANGKEALAILFDAHQAARDFEVVLSDWNMPFMDGLELLHVLRTSEYSTSIPFILLSAEIRADLILEAIAAGLSGCLRKPFSNAQLESALRLVWKQTARGHVA